MWKTLNLELFKPWFIFSFKWNKHLVIKDTSTWVMVINLDWDDCEVIEFLSDHLLVNDRLSHSLYKISHLDLLEETLSNDDISLLIEERYDIITMGDNY